MQPMGYHLVSKECFFKEPCGFCQTYAQSVLIPPAILRQGLDPECDESNLSIFKGKYIDRIHKIHSYML